MPSPKLPSASEQAKIVETSKEVAAARAKRPSWDDIRKEFPNAEFRTRADGQVECKVRHDSDASKRKMLDMTDPWRKAETEVGEKLNADLQKHMVEVQTTSGPRQAHESAAENLDRTSGVRQTWGYSRASEASPFWLQTTAARRLRERGLDG